jgi:hypothetical protein
MNDRISQSLMIQHDDESITEGIINYYQQDSKSYLWTIEFFSSLTKHLKFTNVDLFECLIALRRELVNYSLRPLCNGARLDVYPSGMCRDMGSGGIAYILKQGQLADLDNIVHIFDYSEPELIASIEEQLKFYNSWLSGGKDGSLQQKLHIQHNNGSIVEGELFKYICSNPCKIKFTSSVTPSIECNNTNFFECLTSLRRELVKLNYQPLCNGARLGTYVFCNSIEMLRGNKVYIITSGNIPSQDDSLFIFDYASPSLIVSVDKQREFYESWLRSIQFVPPSEYGVYGVTFFSELYFRLIKIGDLPLMWLFDIDPSMYKNIDDEVEQADDSNELERFFEKFRAVSPVSVEEVSNELKRLRVLSSLSPEQVEEIGSLKGEAILGFIDGEILSLEYFRPNKVFKEFIQKVIAVEAPKDSELQAAALAKREGQLYIIDNRVAELEREATSPEDILGVFEIKDGQIIPDSYQPNENYSIFGNNGLMQLPASLHEALISALLSLSD